LLPSTTEIVFALGAGEQLAGVTFECDFPPEARNRRVVSTTMLPAGLAPAEIDELVRQKMAAGEELYRLDEDALGQIDPDLLLTQDLCAVCAIDTTDVDEAMHRLGCHGRVLTCDPQRLEDVLVTITSIGRAIGCETAAQDLVASLEARLVAVAVAVAGQRRPRTVVLEWTDPPFGPGHWVPDLVVAAGGQPVIGTAGIPSVETTWTAIADAAPDVIVLAPCGYHLPEATALARDVLTGGVLPPDVPVWVIDADSAIVRPGPRLVDGVEALAGILHPGATPPRPDLVAALR
jgi:iron complex transport system substrate-binding protein